MLTDVHPKIPMRNKLITRNFYVDQLDFEAFGNTEYDDYLMLQKDNIQIHFFKFKALDPKKNYGQVYIRVEGIEKFYRSLLDKGTKIHPNGSLQIKPWGQKEFSVLDPDNNLLTFGESS